ncbi:hypothetical protein Taro_045112 [Colocasia esculenta]|uniref:Uncharacterized protein n=1 Tax=Colocasia esculenta TaxID=4460 RepID=A0A843WW84_COLES|nr:hypothetical protein [Colocasia esculenta]
MRCLIVGRVPCSRYNCCEGAKGCLDSPERKVPSRLPVRMRGVRRLPLETWRVLGAEAIRCPVLGCFGDCGLEQELPGLLVCSLHILETNVGKRIRDSRGPAKGSPSSFLRMYLVPDDSSDSFLAPIKVALDPSELWFTPTHCISPLNAIPLSACIAVDAAVPLSVVHGAGGGLRRSFPCFPLLLLLPLSIAFPEFFVLLRFIPIDLRRDKIRFEVPWSYLLIGVVLLILFAEGGGGGGDRPGALNMMQIDEGVNGDDWLLDLVDPSFDPHGGDDD